MRELELFGNKYRFEKDMNGNFEIRKLISDDFGQTAWLLDGFSFAKSYEEAISDFEEQLLEEDEDDDFNDEEVI